MELVDHLGYIILDFRNSDLDAAGEEKSGNVDGVETYSCPSSCNSFCFSKSTYSKPMYSFSGKLLNFLFFSSSVFMNLLKTSKVFPHGIVEDVLLELGNDFHIHPGKIAVKFVLMMSIAVSWSLSSNVYNPLRQRAHQASRLQGDQLRDASQQDDNESSVPPPVLDGLEHGQGSKIRWLNVRNLWMILKKNMSDLKFDLTMINEVIHVSHSEEPNAWSVEEILTLPSGSCWEERRALGKDTRGASSRWSASRRCAEQVTERTRFYIARSCSVSLQRSLTLSMYNRHACAKKKSLRYSYF